MATSDINTQETSIRRVRSAGDIPRFPERARIHSRQRISEGTPRLHDLQPTFSDAHQTIHIHTSPLDRPRSPPTPTVERPPSLRPSLISPGGEHATDQQNTVPPRQEPPAARIQGQAGNAVPAHRHRSFYARFLMYFGLGRGASHARKALVSLIWTACWSTAQFFIITTMLVLTSTFFKSPTQPHLSEWKACDRPLGVWASIWLIRLSLSSSLAYWEFRRDRMLHPPNADAEAGNTNVEAAGRAAPQRNSGRRRAGNDSNRADAAAAAEALPHSGTYSRLSLLSSLMTLSWFLTAHILEYSSVNTCRHSSPHLWWLVFGILCIMYFMVLEVILLGLIVFLIAPIIFICWNIFLICIGRHPLQNPGMIKPDIGKLPKSVVERIPLVMYIPPPPEDEKSTAVVPHAYPPKPPSIASSNATHKRFKLIRNMSSFVSKKREKEETTTEKQKEEKAESQIPISWEDNWEQSDYPFVALEGNRAACAICLMDFEEPKRKHLVEGEKPEESEKSDEKETCMIPDAPVDAQDPLIASSSSSPPQPAIISEEGRDQQMPKLEDAGDGAQPLRLLACGHVFHKTCLDPWLTDVSGRCPVCQRAVEVPKHRKKKKQHRRATTS